MNFIHILNHLGASFAGFALAMLVQSSVLIIALFLLDLALRKKARAVLRYGLWLLVLLKLVLPPSFAAPTGLAYWFPETEIAKPSVVPPSPVVVHYSEMRVVEPPVLQTQPPPRAKLQFAGSLLLVWLAITAGLMALLVRRSRSVVRSAARAFPASELPEQLLDACREQMGIKKRVRLKLYANAGGPAVCGLWRPVILIPPLLADRLSALQLRAVLFHELAHIQRGDVWINYAQSLLQIAYWWHPLLWLANAHIRRVREQAVDERVMVEMGREAEAYPNTLLEVARLASRRPMTALVGIVESKSALAQRIRHLLDRPAPKSAKLGFARLAAVALVGAALLPMARGERKQVAQATAPPPQSLSQTAAIEVEVKFVSLTHAAFESLLGFRPKTIAANGHFVWTLSPDDQAELLQRMERQPDVVTISAPRVTTINARQAQLAVDGIQPFLHPSAAHTSASFQILPHQIGDSIDLAVSAKLTETGDVGSLFGADLGRNPKDDTSNASSRSTSNQVYAVNANGYINSDVGTAQTLVGDGGAAILQNPALTGANGRRILAIISPRMVRQSASVLEPHTNATSVGAPPGVSNPSREAMDARRTSPSNYIAHKISDAAPSNSVPVLGDLPFVGQQFRSQSALASPGRKAIQAKLNRIVLPEISFDNVRLPEAIQRLAKEAIDRDPDGTGVNFLLNPNIIGTPEKAIDPNTDPVFSKPSLQPLDMNSVMVRIDHSLKNVRLSDAIEAIVMTADKPIRYSIEDYAVIFSPTVPGAKHLETRIFRFDPETFFEDAHRFLLDAGLSDIEIFGHSNDWQGSIRLKFFESLGVSLVPPNTIFYTYGKGMLMVRATAEELERVQKAVEKLNALRQKASASQAAGFDATRSLNTEPISFETSKLETRVFRVSPAVFIEGLKHTSGVRTDPETNNSIQDSVRDFFASAGVNVQPPNALFYNDRTGALMVRATPKELDLVQSALELLNVRPPQITIQAKFMELPTEAAMQLGLDLPPPDDRNSNSWTRVLTAAQTRAVLHAADQRVGLDILSTPNVTTLSGRQAQIQQVDIRTVVDGLDPKALAPPGVQSTNGVPAQPYLTSQVACGPTLDVVATVEGDGHTIHLAALPRVTELTQFRQFAGPKESRIWVDGQQQNVPITACSIRTRQMQAAVDVYDGQTLVLANPQVILAFKRLNGESLANPVPEETRKRLIVFITATIIDPAGNAIHVPGKEPFPADKPPPQPAR